MKPPSTLDRICQAAIRTVTRDGLLAMTLENVAKEAGISKGGVMYHFPTKEQLITATLTYYGEQVERMLMTRVANDPEPRQRWARAMINCLFPLAGADAASSTMDLEENLSPELLQKFMFAVIAAAVNNPGVVDPLRQIGKRLRDRLLSDPKDGVDQLLVWLAVDGLFLWHFVGLIEAGDPLIQQLGEALRTRVTPAADVAAITKTPRRRRTPALATDPKGRRHER